jgi:GR25 family glycosyltransferase involved in LPS biosynthesis
MKYMILHYTPLTDRRTHMVQQMERQGIVDYEWVLPFDREHLTNAEYRRFQPQSIVPSEISLFMKHISAMERFCQAVDSFDHEDEWMCVFEDDACLSDQFHEMRDVVLATVPADADVVFGGGCLNLHAPHSLRPHEVRGFLPPYLYETVGSRGAAMYLIRRSACRKFLRLFWNGPLVHQPIDHWFNHVHTLGGLRYFWTEPVMAEQGTMTGLFPTSMFGR